MINVNLSIGSSNIIKCQTDDKFKIYIKLINQKTRLKYITNPRTNMQCFGYRTSQKTGYKNLHPTPTTHVLTLLLLLIPLSSRTPYITPPQKSK